MATKPRRQPRRAQPRRAPDFMDGWAIHNQRKGAGQVKALIAADDGTPLLPRCSMVLAGPPKWGKSALCYEMARREMEAGGRVLVLHGDGDSDLFRWRDGIEAVGDVAYSDPLDHPLRVGRYGDFRELEQREQRKAARWATLVIVDSAMSVAQALGLSGVNDDKTAAHVKQELGPLVRSAKSLILVHHVAKGSGSTPLGSVGWSALADATVMLTGESLGDAETTARQELRSRDRFAGNWGASLTITKGTNADGGPTLAYQWAALSAAASTAGAQDKRDLADILRVIEDAGGTYDAGESGMSNATGLSRDRLRSLRDKLGSVGIRYLGKGKGSKGIYEAADDQPDQPDEPHRWHLATPRSVMAEHKRGQVITRLGYDPADMARTA